MESAYEKNWRRCAANKDSSPGKGRIIRTDRQVYDYLKKLGSARIEWETQLMLRLRDAIQNELEEMTYA